MRKITIAGVVVLVLVVAGVIIYRYQKDGGTDAALTAQDQTPLQGADANMEANTQVPPAEPPPAVAPAVKANPLHAGLTLEGAVAQYRNSGYRFQISNCRATPGTMTVKQSQTKVMFQNFDNKSHTFIVGKQKFITGALDFAIITFAEAGTFSVSCDGAGSAEVLVQK